MKQIAIIIEDITTAKKTGKLQNFLNLLTQKRFKKKETSLFDSLYGLKSGDAFLLNVDEQENMYAIERNFTKRNYNQFSMQANTYSFMYNYADIIQLIETLTEPKYDERSVVELIVNKPEPKPLTRIHVEVKEKVTIFNQFVKIGYKLYERQYDFLRNRDFIVVDGEIFYIKTNRYGQELLVQ